MQKNAYTDLEKALMLQTMQNGGPLASAEFGDYFKSGSKKKKKARRAES
jgi:hypothetical protein